MIVATRPNTGLGSRLKCVASGMRLAPAGEAVTVYWSPTPWEGSRIYGETQYDLAGLLTIDGVEILNRDGEGFRTWQLLDPSRRYLDWQYHRIAPEIVEAYRGIWQRFHLADQVQARAASIEPPAIAMQVRVGQEWTEARRCSVHDVFLKTLRQTEGPVYLACIDPQIEAMLHATFPDKLYSLPGIDRRSLLDTLAEMLILGRARQLYATEHSCLTEVAWWLCGCTAQVTKIGWA